MMTKVISMNAMNTLLDFKKRSMMINFKENSN